MAKSRAEDKKKGKSVLSGEVDLNSGPVPEISCRSGLSPAKIREAVISNRYLQILIVLTAIGAFLRLYHLDFNSLWLDEASTLSFAIQSPADIWAATVGGEFNPPLFYWIEHVMLVFGNSETILRLIPALAGILMIPVLYLIGKELFDKNTGIIAAAILTVSPFHIFYSQEARAYSLALLFVSIALLFFLRAYRSNDRCSWILFGIFSALAFWSHFYSAILVGLLILFTLGTKVRDYGKNLKSLVPLLVGICAFVIICLPLIIAALQLFLLRTSAAPTYGIQGFSIVWISIQQFFGFNLIVSVILLLLFLVGIIQIFRSNFSWGILFSLVIVGTFIVSWALSYKMPMIPRYLLFLLPFFFIGIAAINKPILASIPRKSVIYILIAGLMVLNACLLPSYYSTYSKEDWRGFSQQFGTMTKEGDIVVVLPGYIRQPLNYYYNNSSARTFEYGAYSVSEILNITKTGNGTQEFFIMTGDIGSADPSGEVVNWIQENTTYIGEDMGIYLFRSR
ncbi:MAG: glycosyltransferase family 39 protein [Methanoregulaceae archaeon]